MQRLVTGCAPLRAAPIASTRCVEWRPWIVIRQKGSSVYDFMARVSFVRDRESLLWSLSCWLAMQASRRQRTVLIGIGNKRRGGRWRYLIRRDAATMSSNSGRLREGWSADVDRSTEGHPASSRRQDSGSSFSFSSGVASSVAIAASAAPLPDALRDAVLRVCPRLVGRLQIRLGRDLAGEAEGFRMCWTWALCPAGTRERCIVPMSRNCRSCGGFCESAQVGGTMQTIPMSCSFGNVDCGLKGSESYSAFDNPPLPLAMQQLRSR